MNYCVIRPDDHVALLKRNAVQVVATNDRLEFIKDALSFRVPAFCVRSAVARGDLPVWQVVEQVSVRALPLSVALRPQELVLVVLHTHSQELILQLGPYELKHLLSADERCLGVRIANKAVKGLEVGPVFVKGVLDVGRQLDN